MHPAQRRARHPVHRFCLRLTDGGGRRDPLQYQFQLLGTGVQQLRQQPGVSPDTVPVPFAGVLAPFTVAFEDHLVPLPAGRVDLTP